MSRKKGLKWPYLHNMVSYFPGYMKIKTSDSPVLKCKGFSFVVNNEGSLEKLLDPRGRVTSFYFSYLYNY